LALALVVSSACQAVLGDFTVSPAPPEELEPSLGTECEPDEYRCTAATLERCGDDRSGFVAVQTCASEAECNVNTRSCRPCVPGEHMCRGSSLERCEPTGAWSVVATCDTPELCSVDARRTSGECSAAVCAASELRCTGAELQRCSAGRDGFEAVELCETSELCDVGHANGLVQAGEAPACLRPICAPNAWSCDGATLRHCSYDRKSWTQIALCDSAELCSAAKGACGPCEPGAVECNGAVLRRCKSSGGWETLDTCDAPELCNAPELRCEPAACKSPGSVRCGTGFLPALERCSEALAWETAEVCVNTELCSARAATCLPPACDAQAMRCNGNEQQQCSSDRTRWDVVSTCTPEQLCDASLGCLSGPCTEGVVRCNLTSLEQCVLGRFQELERCGSVALCDAVARQCRPAACAPGEFRCNVRNLQICNAARDDFEEYRSCDTNEICDAVAGECDACVPNAFECELSELFRCSPDGLVLEKVGDCPTSCSVTGSVPSCG
jgi:hypothetical protein